MKPLIPLLRSNRTLWKEIWKASVFLTNHHFKSSLFHWARLLGFLLCVKFDPNFLADEVANWTVSASFQTSVTNDCV